MIGEIPKATSENLTQLRENGLVKQMQTGRNPRLEKLFHDTFYPDILSLLVQLTNNKEDAEDLAQESFTKVIQKLHMYKPTGSFKGWVAKITRNTFYDFVKSKKVQSKTFGILPEDQALVNFFIDNVADDELNTQETLELKELQQKFEKLISQIRPELRKVLIAKIYENRNYKEIAEEAEISKNTAAGRMRYALIRLRKLAKEYGISNFES